RMKSVGRSIGRQAQHTVVAGDRGNSPQPGKEHVSTDTAARVNATASRSRPSGAASTLTTTSSSNKNDKSSRGGMREHFASATPEHPLLRITRDKASKGTRGMPGRQVPMKDVVHCEKRWSVVCRR